MVESFKPPRPGRPARGFIAEDPDACPKCGGRGWVLVPDGGNGSARQCDCRRAERGDRLLASAGIPERYHTRRLANFQALHPSSGIEDQLRRALAASREYVEGFLGENGFVDYGLIYIGPTGAGKTHLATAVTLELIERYRVRARFVEFTDLISQIQATFDPSSQGSKSEILDPLIKAELLVIDELGAQRATAWQKEILYLLVNGRYTRRLPTLFTTNFSLDGAPEPEDQRLDRGRDPEPGPGALEPLARRLPANLISRLHEMARPVLLTSASDFRREVGRARIGR